MSRARERCPGHRASLDRAPRSARPDDVARLLATVPEWFGLDDANAEYHSEAARDKETWTVRDVDGTVVGVTLVERHFPHVAESTSPSWTGRSMVRVSARR